jgi:hypothetical protein
MKPINATPPADFPQQVIVMDREIGKRHPDKGFYLRVGRDGGDVDIVDLDGEMTLPGAVRAAHQKGYEPTHWMETTAGHASRIPPSVQPS